MTKRSEEPSSPATALPYRPLNGAAMQLASVVMEYWRTAACSAGHKLKELPDGWVCCSRCFKLWSPEGPGE